MKRVHAYYSGNVHGVGFRFTAVDVAEKHKVVGWVKNTADGRVELAAEAEEAVLKQFLADLESRMSRYILSKTFSWEPAGGEYKDFRIAY